jgi:RNA polymerase sigma-70 factor (ECF subfamily)
MQESHHDTMSLLELMHLGDEDARDRLIARAGVRLRQRASRMLNRFPQVGRWEETGDVLQNALIRLNNALMSVRLQSVCHFYNLAALQIRRELIDLAKHYQGPQGIGANHHTNGSGRAADDQGGPLDNYPDGGDEPDTIQGWAEFHERVEALPEESREVFGLLWYKGLTQDEAAVVLGVSPKTVQRRWVLARLLLAESMAGNSLP